MNYRLLKINYRLILFFLILNTSSLLAQESHTSLKLIARPLPDSILLRWAPSNYEGWNAGNQYGYKLIRFTLMKDGQMVQQPQAEEVTTSAIKPWPLLAWEQLVNVDNYAAIAAQAIYGKSFEISSQKGKVLQVVQKMKEQDSRFSFTLFAADQSPKAAQASGLWFSDKKVKKGEKYLYRLFLIAPQQIIASDTAFVYTGIDEQLNLPKPLRFKAEFGDKSVMLHWDRKILNNTYNSYKLERSDDGVNFKAIRNKPLVYANSKDFADSDEMLFTDSVPTNGKEYAYRLAGYTAFGETGPYSEILKGHGTKATNAIPELQKAEEQNGSILLKWDFPTAENENIIGFKLARSFTDVSNYDTITNLLPPTSREFKDIKPLSTNYYQVVAYAKNGEKRVSLHQLAQLTDSIPPSPPIGLKAVADTSGKLILSWKANMETDLYGYRVYRANASNEEYAQLTVAPIKDTVFVDHINLKTLTKKIYYKLMAIDKRQNHSKFSIPLEVERPDIVPPAAPVISDIQSTIHGICLHWVRSCSEDVAAHLLYRRAKGEFKAKMIKEIPLSDTTQQLVDNTASVSTTYYYTLVAQDKNGLKSEPSAELAGKMLEATDALDITGLKYRADPKKQSISLSWKKPNLKVSRYVVYRKKGNSEVLAAYASINGEKTEFTDTRLKTDSKYTYCLMAFYENGSSSSGSSCVEVDF